MEKLTRALSPMGPVIMVVGFIFVFAGERLYPSTEFQLPLDGIGAFLIMTGWAKGLADFMTAPLANRFVFGLRFSLEGLAVIGLGLYGAVAQWGDSQSSITTIGLALILFAFITNLSLEWTLPSLRRSQFIEESKIKNTVMGGMSLATLLIGCICLNVLAHRHPYHHDFSFGAPSSPSPATLSLIQSGDKLVEVYVFLPKNNEIVLEIQPYLYALKNVGVRVSVQDSVADPILSKELKISTNGNMAFRYGKQTTKWFLGTNLNTARPRIKTLDHHIRTQLATIIREPSILYFTSGHGERQALAAAKGEKPGGSFFRKLIKELNNEVKEFGITDGLERAIPTSAAALIIFGPTSPLSQGSLETIQSYYQAGGHLLVLVDPEANHGLTPLLTKLGLTLSKDRLCNESIHLRKSYTPADRCLIATNQFTKHPIMKSLSSAGGRTAIVMSSPGHLVKTPKRPPNQKQLAVLRGMPQSFLDSTANYTFDASTETKLLGNLGVAIDWLISGNGAPSGPGRAAVFSDSDLFADNFVGNRANLILAQDTLGWVLGDNSIQGDPNKAEDIPIRHSKNEDILWFYGTTFGAPSLILFGGIGIVRRRRKRKEYS